MEIRYNPSWTAKDSKNELRLKNANVNGNRGDLIERLATYDKNTSQENFSTMSVDEISSQTDVSLVQWPPDSAFFNVQLTSAVPPIDIVHINNYFLEVYTFEEGMSMYAAVQRSGYNMMQSHFLLAMMESKNEEYFFYQAQVRSETTQALIYTVKLVIMHDGNIVEASCECIPVKDIRAACKHVLVVCYALLHLKEHGKLCIKNTCAQDGQIWHGPKKTIETSPVNAQNTSYFVCESSVRKKQSGKVYYDPRPRCYKKLPSYNDNLKNLIINYSGKHKRPLAISGSFAAASIKGIINDHDYLSDSVLFQMVNSHTEMINNQR